MRRRRHYRPADRYRQRHVLDSLRNRHEPYYRTDPDWAGTTVDFAHLRRRKFSSRPFIRAFDVDITLAEARVPMGPGKWQHIEALGKLPSVDAREKEWPGDDRG